MITLAFPLVQYGLAFVFFWTGVLIFRDVEGWANLIRNSWIRAMIPDAVLTIKMVAIFDLVVGVWLATGLFMPVVSGLAALHLLSVLLVVGIFKPTYRDIGLLAMALALFVATI
ncbi:MAG TPA: hypothetical protein VEB18_04340 [Candidatus Paceibacterota bacterium]|nr:hypothetical protein [Candidatus Paceibacterota bacterium]